MSTFDPDAYLLEEPASRPQQRFDPDAYLAESAKTSEFNPAEYLGTDQTRMAERVSPQLASAAAQAGKVVAPVIPEIPGAVGKVAGMAAEIPKDWYNIGKILYNNANLDMVGQAIKEPWRTATNAVGSYVEGHPYLSKVTQATPAQAVQTAVQGAKTLGTGARALGGALVQGAVAPESLFALPYQMAAYEQEKIRENPNAPGLERNPYAMTVRGEAPTQGAAGAMNQRRAVVNMPIQGVTAEERRILEEDQKRKLDLLTRQEAARRVLKPIAPGQ
jgi:hypothetical protein